MRKLKEEYRVCINFVDDTYWDDGSRYTNRQEFFKKKKDALEFIDKIKEEGYRYKGRGGIDRVIIDERCDNISLIKTTETLLDF